MPGKCVIAVATLSGTQSRGLLPSQRCSGLSPKACCRGNAARDSVPKPVAVAMQLLAINSRRFLSYGVGRVLVPLNICRFPGGPASFSIRKPVACQPLRTSPFAQ